MSLKPTINVVIIENEPNTLHSLQNELRKWSGDFTVSGVFKDAQLGFKEVKRNQPDVIFLSINMPFFSGLEMLGNAPVGQSKIVFLATENNYVHQAIKSGRIECLLKPVVIPELKRILKRLKDNPRQTQANPFANQYNRKENFKFNKLSLPTRDGFLFINPKEIMYCLAEQEYTMVRTTDTEILVSKNLKYFESMLDKSRFFRVHKSYLLNLEYIKSYSKSEGGSIEMVDNKVLHVGRSKKKEFSQLMGV